jgi:hypothetical protein
LSKQFLTRPLKFWVSPDCLQLIYFLILETVFKEKLVDVLDSFQEAIKCLSELACNSAFPKVSFDAIQLIKRAAALVSANTDLINSHNTDEELASHTSEMQKVWVKVGIYFVLPNIEV